MRTDQTADAQADLILQGTHIILLVLSYCGSNVKTWEGAKVEGMSFLKQIFNLKFDSVM